MPLRLNDRYYLKHAQYIDSGRVSGILVGNVIKHGEIDCRLFLFQLEGPHVAYYVQGFMNLSVSMIVVHEDMLESI